MGIYLIGPICSGKSTISIELSKVVEKQRISFDHLKHYYFYRQGFNSIAALELEKKGYRFYLDYIKDFEMKALEKTVYEFTDHIVDFGGGIIFGRNSFERKLILKSLDESTNCFCLLPSKDIEESRFILRKRLKKRYLDKRIHLNITSNQKYFDNRSYLNDLILDNINYLMNGKVKFIYTNSTSITDIAKIIHSNLS